MPAVPPPASQTEPVLDEIRDSRKPFVDQFFSALMAVVAVGVVVVVFLIIGFVGYGALPALTGQITTAKDVRIIPPLEALELPTEQLAEYLGQPVDRLKDVDGETLAILIKLRHEELQELDTEEATMNTAALPKLFFPHQWDQYDEPEYIWQPNSEIPKFNVMPLFLGSLKIALIAMAIAIPLGLGAAFYVSQIARPAVRETVKPAIELLAGFPTVVLGFFALIVLASWLQSMFGYPIRLNSLVAGVAVGIAVIPQLFTIAEDAITAVPAKHKDAAIALGADNWYASASVIVPAALPGLFASVVLGFGRALGETMIALMASGNAFVMSWSPFESARTIPATLGQEIAEAVQGTPHYSILFLLGFLLFLVCFIFNCCGEIVILQLKRRLEGERSAEAYSLAGRRGSKTVHVPTSAKVHAS